LLDTLLHEQLGEPATRQLLQNARVVALGPVTAEALAAEGVRVDAIAEDTTDAALLTALRGLLAPTEGAPT
jgi:uroporphyrinogen III methyltransferase/synthase